MKIISIGFRIPGIEFCYEFSGNQSLLDADIILLEPNFSPYSNYQSITEIKSLGKIEYSGEAGFRLHEDTLRLQKEIQTLLKDGKTIFIFLKKPQLMAISQGNPLRDGAYNEINSYSFLPISLPNITFAEGSEINFENYSNFASFFNELKGNFKYECYFDYTEFGKPILFTKGGKKILGSILSVHSGKLVFLPPIMYNKNHSEIDHKIDKYYFHGGNNWTQEGINFGKKLIQAFINLDKSLKEDNNKSTPPTWTTDLNFKTKFEISLEKEIKIKSIEIEELNEERTKLTQQLQSEGKLRDLIFESGKTLEDAVIYALRILGYHAENYNNGILELDQIIISPEGDRFIGETEGKENTAINIDKFRQLSSNILEDAQRSEVSTPAIGILFGNGYRLTHPEKRKEQFTEKCITSAQKFNHILIRTSDFFMLLN